MREVGCRTRTRRVRARGLVVGVRGGVRGAVVIGAVGTPVRGGAAIGAGRLAPGMVIAIAIATGTAMETDAVEVGLGLCTREGGRGVMNDMGRVNMGVVDVKEGIRAGVGVGVEVVVVGVGVVGMARRGRRPGGRSGRGEVR